MLDSRAHTATYVNERVCTHEKTETEVKKDERERERDIYDCGPKHAHSAHDWSDLLCKRFCERSDVTDS